MKRFSANRILSGTWFELTMDGEVLAECYGLQAKRKFNKEKVNLCGQMAVDGKITSIEGTGSVKMHKVYSRMALKVGDMVSRGEDPRFLLISKGADPDAFGTERAVIKNVSFDDETIADWEAGKTGKVECPFTFTDREFLDTIDPR